MKGDKGEEERDTIPPIVRPLPPPLLFPHSPSGFVVSLPQEKGEEGEERKGFGDIEMEVQNGEEREAKEEEESPTMKTTETTETTNTETNTKIKKEKEEMVLTTSFVSAGIARVIEEGIENSKLPPIDYSNGFGFWKEAHFRVTSSFPPKVLLLLLSLLLLLLLLLLLVLALLLLLLLLLIFISKTTLLSKKGYVNYDSKPQRFLQRRNRKRKRNVHPLPNRKKKRHNRSSPPILPLKKHKTSEITHH